MCGITGALWIEADWSISPNTLDRMVDVLRHRGPDDRGVMRWTSENLPEFKGTANGVALGHRRLSIIDLSPQGRQPMQNEDGTVWASINGEIYNFPELRNRLRQQGHVFRGNSDSEIIPHLYEEFGTAFPEHLNGMFAIAIWDIKNQRILLARDRLGEKPLVYRLENQRLIFASEIKSLLQVPGIRRVIDPIALGDYLAYQYVPHPRTIFEGIAKLPPGHLAVAEIRDYWANGKSIQKIDFYLKPYWNPDFQQEDRGRSSEDISEELRGLLASSVEMRMQSDVPLGVFLSGGIDSTIIAGLAAQKSSRPIRTFSIGFPEKQYDETAFARIAAKSFGTEHVELVVSPDIKEVLPRLAWSYDEPFADSSAIPTWYLNQLTREHLSVALGGDGGDELFAGYDRYKAVRWGKWIDHFPRFVRTFLSGPVHRRLPDSISQKSFQRRFKRFLEALGMSPMERYFQWIAIFNRGRIHDLLTENFTEKWNTASQSQNPPHDFLDFLESAAQQSSRRDRTTSISLTDLTTYLPCDLMRKVDTASMSHSLECRAPFLDHRVVELASRIPIHQKIRGTKGKWILRRAFSHLIPPEIEKRGKMGFGVPLDHWFRGPLREFVREILLDSATTRRGFFRPEYVQQLLTEHFESRFDHANRLWSLLFFELWAREWM